MQEEKATEDKIFDAAREVFHQQGFAGARMQEIADRAGINKSLLHYYYRSKDKLFEAVFQVSALKILPQIVEVLERDEPLLQKIPHFVDTYIDLLLANPYLPGFIISELNRHPDRLRKFFGRVASARFRKLAAQIREEVARGEIKPIEPEHLLVNLLGLCVFPFVARPMLQTVLGFDDAAYAAFLQERKQVVTTFILDAVKP